MYLSKLICFLFADIPVCASGWAEQNILMYLKAVKYSFLLGKM